MHKSLYFIVLSVVCLLSACEKEEYSRVGFNAAFNEQSKGLTIMHVGYHVQDLNLSGTLNIAKGGVTVELLDPNDQVVFSREFNENKSINIFKNLPVYKGFWKLKYTSEEGAGDIFLHLYQEQRRFHP